MSPNDLESLRAPPGLFVAERKLMRTLALALGLLLVAPTVASAHVSLQNPLPRTTMQKDRHCGLAGSTRSANPIVYAPGETITVRWTETIDHPGHYRISFDADGEDFTIPLSFTDLTQTENVLVDNITDRAGGGLYEQEITFPDIECETCTLQLIQMMTDKPPYGEAAGEADDIYFLCADIALRPGGGPDAGVDPGAPDAGTDPGGDDEGPANATGGCSTTHGSGGLVTAGLLLGLALGFRRRRRGRSAH